MPHALTSRDSTMESKPVGSYEPTGIDVLIVGTGLAGLVAALECTRKGHNVRVLERNADINTAGKIALMHNRAHIAYKTQVTCISWA
jgi:succinate dehydrogenase/fumarate reductase flavoprotein subunit